MTLGAGLVPTAATDDGVTEAVEIQDARFCVLGVQWHPEEQGDRRPFDALVRAAKEYAAEYRSASGRMNPNVAGRVAVVTGAGRGLGLAGLAVHFAASGLHLGLCARHRPRLAARTRPTAQGGHIVLVEGAGAGGRGRDGPQRRSPASPTPSSLDSAASTSGSTTPGCSDRSPPWRWPTGPRSPA